ncbi:alginate lyase, partial [bacterium]|nr:alginate lyase [bacterium]
MTNLSPALMAAFLAWAAGIIIVPWPCAAQPAPDRPGVVLTRADIKAVRAALEGAPLLAASYRRAKERAEKALAAPMEVPQPVDAGGYTHERHKQNYAEMLLAGQMYAFTGEIKYAHFVRQMLLRYAALYPTLGRHPKAKGEAPGRLFWQVLNETVWLCHVAQAYDCVYDALSLSDRSLIETRLLRPMANYFTDAMPWHHDQAHNHGTWSCAAVGLLGYALKDTVLIHRALYGTRLDRKGGFFFQIDNLFSPDGYYTEGPYYFRYAIWPFYWLA